jgi:hypothetical protein
LILSMAGIMLAPRQFAIEQARIDGRHLGRLTVAADSQVFRAEQPEYLPGGNSGHEVALLIQPLRIAFFGYAIPDEGHDGQLPRK